MRTSVITAHRPVRVMNGRYPQWRDHVHARQPCQIPARSAGSEAGHHRREAAHEQAGDDAAGPGPVRPWHSSAEDSAAAALSVPSFAPRT